MLTYFVELTMHQHPDKRVRPITSKIPAFDLKHARQIAELLNKPTYHLDQGSNDIHQEAHVMTNVTLPHGGNVSIAPDNLSSFSSMIASLCNQYRRDIRELTAPAVVRSTE